MSESTDLTLLSELSVYTAAQRAATLATQQEYYNPFLIPNGPAGYPNQLAPGTPQVLGVTS